MFQVAGYRGRVSHAAVEDHGKMRKCSLECVNALGLQRRDVAVLRRGQSVEQGLASVEVERVAAGVHQRGDEAVQVVIGVGIVDAKPTLHGDGQ